MGVVEKICHPKFEFFCHVYSREYSDQALFFVHSASTFELNCNYYNTILTPIVLEFGRHRKDKTRALEYQPKSIPISYDPTHEHNQ